MNRRDNRFIFKYTGYVNEFNPLVDKLNFDKMPDMINFGVYIWPASKLLPQTLSLAVTILPT